MSVDITQAVITGNELPAGDLVSIFRYPDDVTGVWWVYKPVTDGTGISPLFHRKPFYTMPPTANDNVFVNSSASYFSITGLPGVPKDITKIFMDGYVSVNQSTRYLNGVADPAPMVSITPLDGQVLSFFALSGTTSKIAGLLSLGLHTTILAGGTTADGVARNVVSFYTHAVGYNNTFSPKTASLDFSKCTITGNEVVIQGIASSIAPNFSEIFVLLTVDGVCAAFDRLDVVTSNEIVTPTTYVQLTVPVGGEIKYFGRQGYYIASDVADDLFLYSITNNGTLITQLTPGSFDITKHIELFEFL